MTDRTYMGYTIDRTDSGEWWRAWFVDNAPRACLMADTLSGLKALVRHYHNREGVTP